MYIYMPTYLLHGPLLFLRHLLLLTGEYMHIQIYVVYTSISWFGCVISSIKHDRHILWWKYWVIGPILMYISLRLVYWCQYNNCTEVIKMTNATFTTKINHQWCEMKTFTRVWIKWGQKEMEWNFEFNISRHGNDRLSES